ncbi:hypothetical protein L195_g044575, partial [Trifolium pratense]
MSVATSFLGKGASTTYPRIYLGFGRWVRLWGIGQQGQSGTKH